MEHLPHFGGKLFQRDVDLRFLPFGCHGLKRRGIALLPMWASRSSEPMPAVVSPRRLNIRSTNNMFISSTLEQQKLTDRFNVSVLQQDTFNHRHTLLNTGALRRLPTAFIAPSGKHRCVFAP